MTTIQLGKAASPAKWVAGFRADYKTIFVDEWPPFVGIIFIVLALLALMANGLFWGIFGGLKLWGDWLNHAIGLGDLLGLPKQLENPLIHRLSLMNIVLVLGAFSAALMSRQFLLNRPPKLELVWGALGGTLMGTGAALAGGCTTGGFFTPVLHSSPAGWAMWFGLIVGAVIGLKLLLWTLDHIEWGMQSPPALQVPRPPGRALPVRRRRSSSPPSCCGRRNGTARPTNGWRRARSSSWSASPWALSCTARGCASPAPSASRS